MAEQTYSPQAAAFRGLIREHQATRASRHVRASGSIRVTIWNELISPDPVCKALIDTQGRVVTDLMDPVIT